MAMNLKLKYWFFERANDFIVMVYRGDNEAKKLCLKIEWFGLWVRGEGESSWKRSEAFLSMQRRVSQLREFSLRYDGLDLTILCIDYKLLPTSLPLRDPHWFMLDYHKVHWSNWYNRSPLFEIHSALIVPWKRYTLLWITRNRPSYCPISSDSYVHHRT
jgi:hypothetical protein